MSPPLTLCLDQPHEDGPSYYPVVATISLGSHAMFHYYRYANTAVGIDEGVSSAKGGKGKRIDMTPVMSVLLEPRSLVITTRELYTTHLHGINDVQIDIFPAPGDDSEFPTSTEIANVELISDSAMKTVVQGGGSLGRQTRYSLTCRDIERVAGRGMGLGRR